MDDINYLLHRRQVALTMAAQASSEIVRRVHEEFADRYGTLIEQRGGDPAVAAEQQAAE